jgi:hypothetical protein
MTMKQEPISKAAVTRKLNQLGGVRPTLPGHDHDREASLRAELAADFKPVGAVEMLWLADIAYCTAVIEVIRAQMNGLRLRMVEEACRQIIAALRHSMPDDMAPASEYSQEDLDELTAMVERGFVAPWHGTFLNKPVFTSLLARASKSDIDTLRTLQLSLHEETKERDRIINQLDRRRRNAMRDAIELAEEARRVELFRQLSARETGHVDAIEDGTIEDASFELISSDDANAVLEDLGHRHLDGDDSQSATPSRKEFAQ